MKNVVTRQDLIDFMSTSHSKPKKLIFFVNNKKAKNLGLDKTLKARNDVVFYDLLISH